MSNLRTRGTFTSPSRAELTEWSGFSSTLLSTISVDGSSGICVDSSGDTHWSPLDSSGPPYEARVVTQSAFTSTIKSSFLPGGQHTDNISNRAMDAMTCSDDLMWFRLPSALPQNTYRCSGFSGTLLDSLPISGANGSFWDGVDLVVFWPWISGHGVYRYSGFSSTFTSLLELGSVGSTNQGTWNGDDLLALHTAPGGSDSLRRYSGYSSTIAQSASISNVTQWRGSDWSDYSERTSNGGGPEPEPEPEPGEGDLLWCGWGTGGDRLYAASGFSATIANSLNVGARDQYPNGVTWDGADATWCGTQHDRIYRQSGLSSTLVDSFSVPSPTQRDVTGVSWTRYDLIAAWTDGLLDGAGAYRYSGHTSTLVDEIQFADGVANIPGDITWDGADALWIDNAADIMVRQSGFSATISASLSIAADQSIGSGITWDGANAIMCGSSPQKLFRYSGFSSTLVDSVSVASINSIPSGVEHKDLDERVPVPQPPSSVITTRTLHSRPIRHRSVVQSIGHPSQHAAHPAVPPEVAGVHLRTRVVHSRPVRHRSVVQSIGHPSQHADPPPKLIPGILRIRSLRSRPIRHRSRVLLIGPHLIDVRRRYFSARGLARVFNAAGYRIYRSNVAPPEEGDTPWATSETLPVTPSGTFADGTWYISLSWFNGVLDSGFLPIGPQGETYVRLDIAGGEGLVGMPPGPALGVRLQQRPGGVVRVLAYHFCASVDPATHWALTYTVDGSTPDEPPDEDPTEAIAMRGLAMQVLSHDLPPQAHGTTVKVRLQTRTAEAVYSEGSQVLTLVVDAQGPSAPVAGGRWCGRVPEEV